MWDGTLERLHHQLYAHIREQAAREASPTAAIIDRQSVPSAPKGGISRAPVGDDGGKTVKSVTDPIVVDTLGLLWNAAVHPTDLQHREGASRVLNNKARALFQFIEGIVADGGYQGPVAAEAVRQTGTWSLDIVQRSDPPKGVVVRPKRGMVERTLSWLSRCRRLVRHDEQDRQTSVALLRLARVRVMLRRLARQ